MSTNPDKDNRTLWVKEPESFFGIGPCLVKHNIRLEIQMQVRQISRQL